MYSKILLLLFMVNTAFASPWMTGPLLAPSGKTIPAGHVNFEPYGFYTMYPGNFRNVELLPVLTVGVTNFLDVQTSLPVDHSWNHGQQGGNIGDYSLGIGLQVLREQEHSWVPNLRMTIQEVFPTGKFDHLNPNKLGTDQTGIGAYQTAIGFHFQKLKDFGNDHYLRSRLSLLGSWASDVHVEGASVFGGNDITEGDIKPGNSFSADLAFEYSLTQHWVPVFELLFVDSNSSDFNGNPGLTPGGVIDSIGGGGGTQLSLAPALEYNFSPQLGVIGGVWFAVTGPSGGGFTSLALAVNYYF
jgi:hypothetical protein